MSHKLTGKALEYVALNVEKCSKDWLYKRVMNVTVGDASAGKRVCQYLVEAYGPKKYFPVEGWKKFGLRFEYVWQRDQAVADVNAAQSAYFDEEPDTEEPTDPEKPEKEEETETDWTTYIIIGVAAAVILLLLWDNKRK